jgi:hypothetical protein
MTAPNLPRTVGDYFLPPQQEPRRGGMSVVYKAVNPSGATVAVKVLTRDPKTASTYDLLYSREKHIELLDHPHVARLVDSGHDANLDQWYLVYTWAEHDLLSFLDEHPHAREWDVFHRLFARPLTDALAHAHQRKVLHRDIKPGNVVVDADGTALIADFGISKYKAGLEPAPLTFLGARTDRYCPEEERASYDNTRDVYALAATIVDALSADRSFPAEQFQDAVDDLPVSAPVAAWLRSCLDPDPNARPEDGLRMLVDLDRAVGESGPQQRVVVHLDLKRSAVTRIRDALNIDAAAVAAFVAADLEGACLEIAMKKAPGDPDEYNLSGSRLSYRLVEPRADRATGPDDIAPVLAVVFALPLDDDRYDRVRASAWEPPVRWTFDPPVSRASALSDKRWLLAALAEQQQRKLDDAKRRDEDRELAQWSALLRAMEALEQAREKPLAFSESYADGHTGRFRVTEQLTPELLDQPRSVRALDAVRGRVHGVVESIDGQDLMMRFDESVQSLPRRGHLIIDAGGNRSAIAQQQRAVNAVRFGTTDLARPELRDLVLDPGSAQPPGPIRALLPSIKRLDEPKQHAVRSALGVPDIYLVEGPPGTGKTSFIAEFVVQMLAVAPDTRILLASQTHVALDNAIVRLHQLGVDRLVRLSSDEAKVAEDAQPLLMDVQVQQWGKSIRERSAAYLAALAEKAGLPADSLERGRALQELARFVEQEMKIEARLVELEQQVQETADPVTGLPFESDERVSRQADLDRAVDELALARRRRREFSRTHRGLLPSDAAEGDAAALTFHAASALDDLFAGAPALRRLLAIQVDWLRRIQVARGLEPALLQTRNVVAGTCIGFANAPGMSEVDPFDVCIIDEASKATATQALVPMIRSRKWVMVGDPRQLPPMQEEVLRDEALVERYQLDKEALQETLFDRLLRAPAPSKALLSTQHRMTKAIGDLISNCFYAGALDTINDQRLSSPLLPRPVTWVDTSGHEDRREQRSPNGSRSKINALEVKVVRRLLEAMLREAHHGRLALPGSEAPLEVLVLAPYAEQVRELQREIIGLSASSRLRIRAHTVDAVQGQECDITVFSCTRSNAGGDVGFLGEAAAGRINVALSRSKLGLVLVGDVSFWADRPVPLAQVLRWIREEPDDCQVVALAQMEEAVRG